MLKVGLSALTGGIQSGLLPIVALVLLAPAEYGLFSIVYLVFAFGLSLQYSLVSEAWARARRSTEGTDDDWPSYSGAILSLALLVAVAALGVGLAVEPLRPTAAILFGAVLLGVYRSASRYHAAAERRLRSVIVSDVAASVLFVATVAALVVPAGPLTALALGWLAAGVAGSVALRLPALRRGHGPLAWLRTHGREIRPLLLDSLLMDAGAIGTPLILAGPLGAAKFGVYRAISNVALPVRLLVDPIRPQLGRAPTALLLGARATALIFGAAAVLAVLCFAALEWVVPAIPVTLGTLSSLAQYALPSAIFVVGSLVGTVYYIVCRTRVGYRSILFGRVSQTVLVIAMPLAGAVVGGLTGAIWGFVVSACTSGLIWCALAFRARRAAAPAPA